LAFAVGFAFTLTASAFTAGCGGREAPIEAPAPPPKARNAAEIAWDIVHAQVGAMIYVERVRGRPIAEKIASLELFRPFLEGTGIQPEVALDRAFVAAPATNRADEAIVVAEHRLSKDRVIAAIDHLFAAHRLDGAWLDAGGAVPMARVTVRGHTRVLALIEPNFVILLPEAHALEATRFINTGGFPDPAGPEAVLARAMDPSRTVVGPRVPAFPPTLQSAVATITLTDDGGADVAVDAPSQSPEQAAADAAALTQSVDEATSIKVAIVRFRVFKPIPFYAEGDRVASKVHLTSSEIDTLFGVVSTILPR
jgi:hypothetical protein